jgi:hypothetical protein
MTPQAVVVVAVRQRAVIAAMDAEKELLRALR